VRCDEVFLVWFIWLGQLCTGCASSSSFLPPFFFLIWSHDPWTLTSLSTPAFFGIMDLLAILPDYIEIALHKDTVSLLSSNPPLCIILSDASSPIPSRRSFISRSCAHFACFAFSVCSAITAPFCYVFLFLLPSLLSY
jgi:hypothetical protein